MLKNVKSKNAVRKTGGIQGSVLGLCLITSSVFSATQQNFYVSPTGDDTLNPGTLSAPFKTLEKARDAVRSINSDMTGDIFVNIRGGNYPITDTITLTSVDSGTNGHRVVYQAYNDETPVLNGATLVTGWTQHDGNIYKATFNSDEKLRTLIVNGERAYMASTDARPNGDWGTYTITAGQADWARVNGTEADGGRYNLSDIPTLTNASDVEIMNKTTWNTNFVTVRESVIEGSERVLKFSQPYAAIAQNQNWGAFSNSGTHTLFNAYEFLDEANEFYLDRSSNTLYYYNDGLDMNSAQVYAPQTDAILNLAGDSTDNRIKNITFSGITFANTQAKLPEVAGSAGKSTVQAATWKLSYSDGNWHNDKYTGYDVLNGAINVNNAQSISIEDGAIKNAGNEGINFTNDVIDSQIVGNAITGMGGSGINISHPQHVYIGDGGTYEKYPIGVEGVVQNILVKNNLIYDVTQIYYGHAAITAFFTDGLTIEHNQIQKTKYSGVSLGWGWNNFAVETLPDNPTTVARNNKFNNNHVYDVMTYLHDGGAFYTLGSQPNSEANGNYVKAPTTFFQGVYHPDEGTAYYTGNDLVFEIVPGQDNFELNKWRDKRDNHYDNIYSTSGAYQIGAPNSTITNLTVVPDADWPQEALDIIANSGLEDDYLHLLIGIPDAPDVPGLIDSSGYTLLEAESGSLFGSGSVFTDSNASGGAGIENIHTAGSGVTFTNMAAATSLFVTYASKNTGSYSIYVDGEHAADLNFTATGGWSRTYSNTEAVSVNIPEGATLTLQKDSDDSGINIDYISLINQSLTQQAENGILLGAAKVSTEHAGFEGTGFVGDIFNIGDSVQFSVNVIDPGQYILTPRYAMGLYGPEGVRTMSVYVNGSDQVQHMFTSTGEWNVWGESSSVITLLPGANDIKLQLDADDTGVINLDQFSLTKIYEAEEATLTGTTSDNSYEGFSGFGFVSEIDDIGDSVAFTVNVAIAGEYTLDMRYAVGADGPAGERTMSVVVNDTDLLQSSFASTGTWDSWSNQTETVSLQSGENTILYRLDADDTGWVNFDYLLIDLGLTNDNDDDDTPIDLPNLYEAEDASISGNRIGISSEHPGYNGSGFVGNIITIGDKIEFTVDLDTAGFYVLNSRYTMGTFGPSGNRTLSVYVNDEDTVQSSFSTTVEWDNWSDNSDLIPLQAGTNTIKFQLDEDDTGWINLDYIQLEFDSALPVFGDFDADQDVDMDDVNLFYQHIRAQTLSDLSYDFTHDGQLSSRDVRGFMSLCTRAACATE
ncbi:CBM35 domain-containing protein [Paraglaciecola arctica]|uniref:CBM35 domain-containing protein n=1 Tax=Paraglaciecola arctica TaxID=1128911 RepID=UPI001C06BC2B|nr:CBM35 domain-containing protein [Paraglaciecola arctica]MBU3003870.1 carbohydrate-binding protein [Paraglaciecola arctica]